MTSSRVPEPGLLGVQLVDLLLRSSATSPVNSPSCRLEARPARPSPSRRSRFSSVSRAVLAPRPPAPLRVGVSRRRRRAPPRSRSDPGRRSPSRTGSRCVARYSRASTSASLSSQLVDLLPGSPRRSSARPPSAAPRAARSLFWSTPRAACSSCACVTWYLELRRTAAACSSTRGRSRPRPSR